MPRSARTSTPTATNRWRSPRQQGKAADDIEKVQSELPTLQHGASALHMTIDPVSHKIVPAETMPPMEAEIAELQLQPRLDKILGEANAVDAELAAAINMADGDTPCRKGRTRIGPTSRRLSRTPGPRNRQRRWHAVGPR